MGLEVAAQSPYVRGAERRSQVVDDEDEEGMTGSRGLGKVIDMSFLRNETSGGNFVDGSGVGHVRVNDSMDWSDILPNDTTVRIIYHGSGSMEEILLVPVNGSESDSGSAAASASASASSSSMSGNDTVSPGYDLPTGSNSSNSSSGDDTDYSNTGSTPTTLAFVAASMAIVAVIIVVAMVGYGRRSRRYWQQRRVSEPSSDDQPFIVGSLPPRPVGAGPVSILDTDITPDQWVEGRYSADPFGQSRASFSGTVILSDNHTTPSHRRLTVDVFPFASHRNRIDENQLASLDDIVQPGRNRTGTAPVVLYDRRTVEDCTTAASRRPSSRYPNSRQSSRQPARPPTIDPSRPPIDPSRLSSRESSRPSGRQSSRQSSRKDRVSRILL